MRARPYIGIYIYTIYTKDAPLAKRLSELSSSRVFSKFPPAAGFYEGDRNFSGLLEVFSYKVAKFLCELKKREGDGRGGRLV